MSTILQNLNDSTVNQSVNLSSSPRWERFQTRIVEVSLGDLCTLMRDGCEVPDCQRDFVWNQEKADAYVDSIMTGYMGAPIQLIPDGKGKYHIIDGGHRSKLIYALLEGENIVSRKGEDIFARRRYIDGDNHSYIFAKATPTTEMFQAKYPIDTSFFTDEEVYELKKRTFKLEIFNHVLTEEEKRTIFNNLQSGVPVRNSDKDRNDMKSVLNRRLTVGSNIDFNDRWLKTYRLCCSSEMMQNRWYIVTRIALLSAFVTRTPEIKDPIRWLDDTNIKRGIGKSHWDNILEKPGMEANIIRGMTHVFDEFERLHDHLDGAKLTPYQCHALVEKMLEPEYSSKKILGRAVQRFIRNDTVKRVNVDTGIYKKLWLKKPWSKKKEGGYPDETTIEFHKAYYKSCIDRLNDDIA